MHTYVALKSTDGKTWEIFGSPKSSLSALSNSINKPENLKKLKDNETIILTKASKKLKAKIEYDICQECGKPYEYSDKVKLEETDVQLNDTDE